MEGKEAVTSAVKEFIAYFKALTIKAVCGSETKAMVAYDVEFPAPIGLIRTAVLLTLCDGLIIDYEIFFDASPMRK